MACQILPRKYDKVPKALNFRFFAQKHQLNILVLKDATSICRREVASFNSRIMSLFFGARSPKLCIAFGNLSYFVPFQSIFS